MLTSAVDSVFGVLVSPIYPPTSQDLDRFSHLGGLPSLPPGMEWPRAANGAPFHFLAQIDLATVPVSGIVDFRGSPLPEFPREGALYFFADCATYGIWEQPEASHRVLYAADLGATRPVQPPPDLMPHNAPDAGVLVHTHAPYFPRLRPRPLVLLPHVPIALIDMAAVPRLPREALRATEAALRLPGQSSWIWDSPGAGWFWSGSPYRWTQRRASSSCRAISERHASPGTGARQRNVHSVGFRRWSPMSSAIGCAAWLRAIRMLRLYGIRFYVELCFWEAIRAAWPWIAFSGDLSDIPSQLVQYLRPMEQSPTGDYGHHKILGDAISVQAVQMADESNVLLLRLDSDETPGFCWGDVGILHIAVPRDDLAARNFTRTHLNADCL